MNLWLWSTNQNRSHVLTYVLRNNIPSAYLRVQNQFHTTYLKCEFHPNCCLQPLDSVMLLFMDYWPLLLVTNIFVYGLLIMVLLFSSTIGHCYCLWAIDHGTIILHGPLVIVVVHGHCCLWAIDHGIIIFRGPLAIIVIHGYCCLWVIDHVTIILCGPLTIVVIHGYVLDFIKKCSSMKESKQNAT